MVKISCVRFSSWYYCRWWCLRCYLCCFLYFCRCSVVVVVVVRVVFVVFVVLVVVVVLIIAPDVSVVTQLDATIDHSTIFLVRFFSFISKPKTTFFEVVFLHRKRVKRGSENFEER